MIGKIEGGSDKSAIIQTTFDTIVSKQQRQRRYKNKRNILYQGMTLLRIEPGNSAAKGQYDGVTDRMTKMDSRKASFPIFLYRLLP